MIKFKIKIQNKQHKISCIICAKDWAEAIEKALETTQMAAPVRVFAVAL